MHSINSCLKITLVRDICFHSQLNYLWNCNCLTFCLESSVCQSATKQLTNTSWWEFTLGISRKTCESSLHIWLSVFRTYKLGIGYSTSVIICYSRTRSQNQRSLSATTTWRSRLWRFCCSCFPCDSFWGWPCEYKVASIKYASTFTKVHRKQILGPFPTIRAPKPQGIVQKAYSFNIEIWCLCRLPQFANANMMECSECTKWFHKPCVNLQDNTEPVKLFTCPMSK